jgi:hypothetical protein
MANQQLTKPNDPRMCRSEQLMTTEVDHMLDFIRCWYRYGGGSAEDIFIRFGVTADLFFGRVDAAIAQQRPSRSLPAQEIAEIRNVCRRRMRR